MPSEAGPALSETMLAMDVVDTLRHADTLVERELRGDERREQLKQRLRDIYRGQGIEVPARILEEGVAAMEESRFTYRPEPASFRRTLAQLWVTRARWGALTGVALAVMLLAGGGWFFGAHLPAEREATATRQELSTGLPIALRAERERVVATGNVQATGEADRLLREGEAAARAGDVAGGRERLAQLRELQSRLARDYAVRIVSRPGEPSGVWRVPRGNPGARNFYLVVEAVGRDGRPTEVPVTSEEDGRRATVSRWGQRVTPEEFERVRRDKLADGVIDQPEVGRKRPGRLDTEWSIATVGGAILQW